MVGGYSTWTPTTDEKTLRRLWATEGKWALEDLNL